MRRIEIREDTVDVAVAVNAKVTEFTVPCDRAYFEDRYGNREKLILAAYADDSPAGYLVGYRSEDGSFYCWMTGVDPRYRRLGMLRRMMDRMEDWARGRGYGKITIKTRNRHRGMLAYLVKAGYLFTEVQPHLSLTDASVLLEKPIG